MILLSLLNKFNNIEIQTHDKISAEDKEFCENQQFVYDKAYDCFANVKEQYKTLSTETKGICYKDYGTWKDEDSCLRHIHYLLNLSDYIKDMNYKFLCNIYFYFRRTYKISLDEYKRESQFKVEKRFTYHEIVDLIIEEIGGFSFEEAEIINIKNKLKDTLKYNKPIIKNDTIIFEKLIRWSYDKRWDKDYHSYIFDNFMKVINAIKLFDKKKNINVPDWSDTSTRYFEQLENPMSIDGDMLKQIKIFKNGKVEMKFNSNENTLKFAKEWCSYGDY